MARSMLYWCHQSSPRSSMAEQRTLNAMVRGSTPLAGIPHQSFPPPLYNDFSHSLLTLCLESHKILDQLATRSSCYNSPGTEQPDSMNNIEGGEEEVNHTHCKFSFNFS